MITQKLDKRQIVQMQASADKANQIALMVDLARHNHRQHQDSVHNRAHKDLDHLSQVHLDLLNQARLVSDQHNQMCPVLVHRKQVRQVLVHRQHQDSALHQTYQDLAQAAHQALAPHQVPQ